MQPPIFTAKSDLIIEILAGWKICICNKQGNVSALFFYVFVSHDFCFIACPSTISMGYFKVQQSLIDSN
jgi:hypothetical protein